MAVLEVTVERGENFPKLDVWDETDPFVTLSISGSSRKFRSATKNNAGENPIWRETFQYSAVSEEDSLYLSAYDEDTLTKNDIIGSCTIEIGDLAQTPGKPIDRWCELTGGPQGRDPAKPIRLKLTLTYLPQGKARLLGKVDSETLADSASGSSTPTGILSLWLIRGEDLRASPDDTGEAPVGPLVPGAVDLDPYAVISLGDQAFRSASCPRTRTPQWNQKMTFLVEGRADRVLRISVYDYDLVSADDICSTGDADILDILRAGGSKGDRAAAAEVSVRLRPSPKRFPAADPGLAMGTVHLRATWEPLEQASGRFWRYWFDAMDADRNGRLDDREAAGFLTQVLGDVTSEEATAIVAEADANGDGAVCPAEFAAFLARGGGGGGGGAGEGGRAARWRVGPGLVLGWLRAMDAARLEDLAAGFVTEEQAARGVFACACDWMISGGGAAYGRGLNVGAKAGHVVVFNRELRILEEERIHPALNLGMRCLYQGATGAVMRGLARRTGAFLKMSREHGEEFDRPDSKGKIAGFIESFGISRAECVDSDWPTFNRFFTRRLRPEARPIAEPARPEVAVQPADSRLMVFPRVEDSTRLWIKGRNFTLAALLNDPEQARYFEDGAISVHRLAPQDYHRFHVPIDCTVGETLEIPGELWTVNPVAVNAIDVFTENRRNVTYLHSERCGRIALVAVGAHMVGSIRYTGGPDEGGVALPPPGAKMTKGQDMGFFQFGGSTVICVWPKGAIAFDEDLVEQARQSTEVLVRMGQSLGRLA